jgi:prepilin-type N-terminal cleavage/methylation domain-containing protein
MKIKQEKGFTLIEVLIAMVITGVLGLGIVSLQYIIGKNQLLIVNNYKSIDEANTSVTNFVREIRAAHGGNNGAYLLEKVDDKEIIFYSDIDYDGQTEKVDYSLSGTNLIKGVIKPTGYPPQYPEGGKTLTTLSTNVRNGSTPVFYYYNSNWPQDTVNNPLILGKRLSDTRLIKIYLLLNTQQNDPNHNFILESFAQIRMLKDNL